MLGASVGFHCLDRAMELVTVERNAFLALGLFVGRLDDVLAELRTVRLVLEEYHGKERA